MKNLFLILVFTTISVFAFGQTNYRATYQLQYQPDSTDVENIREENFLLYMDGERSQFLSYNNALRDSIRLKINSGEMSTEEIVQQTMSRPRTKFNIKINKSYDLQKMEVLDEMMTELYMYEESLDLFSWNIKNESKQINGYECKKAVTSFAGRKYVAWFDPEIPISDGPYKFNGLPGLIISIYDTDNHYKFELIGLERMEFEIRFNLLDENYQSIEKAEYRKMKRNENANAAAMAKQIMSNMKMSEEQKRELKKKKKGENNPIEL